jgi:hypothetical protein
MSWRNGSAFAALGAANTAITVTTTTPIAAGERVILAVWRQQAATGTAVGNPTVSTLGGNAFTTLAITELFTSPFYSGISTHSFIAPGTIGSGATLTVTPGNANQKVAAMLIVQGDPHPTQVPYADTVLGVNLSNQIYGNNATPGFSHRGLTWDKRLIVDVIGQVSGGAATPWSSVNAMTSVPINGFTEALETTVFSYGFVIDVREDSSNGEPPSDISGLGNTASFGGTTTMAVAMVLVRAGAAQPTLGPDVFEYNDFPSNNQPGAGSRPLVGQIWPR